MHVKSLAFCVWEWRRYTHYIENVTHTTSKTLHTLHRRRYTQYHIGKTQNSTEIYIDGNTCS